MKLVWSDPAVADLSAIHGYISRDSEPYARRMIERILESVEPLKEFPEMGRRVPEMDQGDLRELIVQSYRVIYRVRDERLQILTVVHSSQDLSRQFR